MEITATGIPTRLRSAAGATILIIPTLARLTATTARAGSSVASLSAPARGIAATGVAVDTMVAEGTMVAVDTTAEPGIAVV